MRDRGWFHLKGIEAGQSAVGDIFNWFIEKSVGAAHRRSPSWRNRAAKLKPGQSGLMALDWQNGNQYPGRCEVDEVIVGLARSDYAGGNLPLPSGSDGIRGEADSGSAGRV